MVRGAAPDRRTLKEIARAVLDEAGATDIAENVKIAPGVPVSFRVTCADGVTRLFELAGTHTPARPGLHRIEVVWRAIAKAAIAAQQEPDTEFVLLTSGTVRGGPLAAVVGPGRPIARVVDVTLADAAARLIG